ncbi:MAG: hypothetical protein PHP62_00340 [Candidatus Moranbacteria bacterium]|nr:hypothetical protein [Candidatus Moranbacteria bacterium]
MSKKEEEDALARQDEIFLSIITEAKQQALGEKVLAVLLKIFGKKTQNCRIEDLPGQDAIFLEEFFGILTKIFREGNPEYMAAMEELMSKFLISDFRQLMSLSTNNQIGNQRLANGLSDMFMRRRK